MFNHPYNQEHQKPQKSNRPSSIKFANGVLVGLIAIGVLYSILNPKKVKNIWSNVENFLTQNSDQLEISKMSKEELIASVNSGRCRFTKTLQSNIESIEKLDPHLILNIQGCIFLTADLNPQYNPMFKLNTKIKRMNDKEKDVFFRKTQMESNYLFYVFIRTQTLSKDIYSNILRPICHQNKDGIECFRKIFSRSIIQPHTTSIKRINEFLKNIDWMPQNLHPFLFKAVGHIYYSKNEYKKGDQYFQKSIDSLGSNLSIIKTAFYLDWIHILHLKGNKTYTNHLKIQKLNELPLLHRDWIKKRISSLNSTATQGGLSSVLSYQSGSKVSFTNDHRLVKSLSLNSYLFNLNHKYSRFIERSIHFISAYDASIELKTNMRVLQIRHLLADKRFNDAQLILEKLIARTGVRNLNKLYHLQGLWKYFQSHNRQEIIEAINWFQKANKEYQTWQTFYAQAYLLIKIGEYSLAQSNFAHIESILKHSREKVGYQWLTFLKAKILYEKGALEHSYKLLEEIIESDKTFHPAYDLKVKILRNQKKYQLSKKLEDWLDRAKVKHIKQFAPYLRTDPLGIFALSTPENLQ